MAQPLSPFDLLPDEVLLKILTETGRRRGEDAYDLQFHVRDFIMASSVCKRWASLSFQVRELDWSLTTHGEALSLVNFVQDNRVSLDHMNLYGHLPSLHHIRLAFVFNALFKSRFAPRVDVFIVDPPSELETSEEALDIGGLLHLLLCCRKLEHLSISARSLLFGCVARVEGSVNAAFNICTLALVDVEVPATGLQSIWSVCKKLEDLCINMLVAGPDAPRDFDLESDVIISLCLAQSLGTEFPPFSIKASRLTNLESNCQVRFAGTPALEKLTLGVNRLALLPLSLAIARFPLKHLALKEAPGSVLEPEKCWRDIIKPILRVFAGLETLELARLGGALDQAIVPMDKFLIALGPSLRTLRLSHGALHLLGHPSGPLGTHLNLQNIIVSVDYLSLAGFLKVLAFKKGFPSLQRVEIHCELYDMDLEASRTTAAEMGITFVHKEAYSKKCGCWFC